MIPVSRAVVTLATAAERAENVASVSALPTASITGEALVALCCLARGGADMNIYRPTGPTDPMMRSLRARLGLSVPASSAPDTRPWRIWLRPISPAWEGRMSLSKWADVYALSKSFRTDSAAVIALSGRYALLLRVWETALQATDADWRRPAGMTITEQALSLLYWRSILVAVAAGGTPDLGHARFLTLVASGDLKRFPT